MKKNKFCMYYLIFAALVVVFEWFFLPLRDMGNADEKKFGVLISSFFGHASGLTMVLMFAGVIFAASAINSKDDTSFLWKMKALTIISIAMLYIKVTDFGSDLGQIFVYAGEKNFMDESYIKFMDWMTYLKDAACVTLLILAFAIGKPFTIIGFKIDDLKLVNKDLKEETIEKKEE